MVFEFTFPDVGEGLTEGEIVKWHVKENDKVKKDQVVAEVETAKAVVEIPCPHAGIIKERKFKEGDTVKVGETLLVLDDGTKGKAQPEKSMAEKSGGVVGVIEEASDEKPQQGEKIHIEKKQGEGGKALQAMRTSTAFTKEVQKPTLAAPKVVMGSEGKTLHIPLSNVRRAIANQMTKSWSTIPHVMHFDEADVTELWDVRKKEKVAAEKKKIHLTFLPFIVRACVAACKQNPYLNASLDEEKGIIVVKNYYNVGIAVDAPQGLVVPVVKQADQKSILDIAQEIQDFAEKARDKKLTPAEMQGGTFTITNIGSVGGIAATPIINHPESAILGLYRIVEKPVVREGKVVIRKILPLTVSFDHRIVDGAKAAKFMNEVKAYLEDPDKLLVDMS